MRISCLTLHKLIRQQYEVQCFVHCGGFLICRSSGSTGRGGATAARPGADPRISGVRSEKDLRKDILTGSLPSININGGQFSNITETSF